jgi:cytoskeletal protein CcmA (bactofilin family)
VAIVCLYCDREQEVSRRALTVTCKHCSKSLRLEDLKFKGYEARRTIDTCGTVTVEKKGNVVSDRVNCGGLVVRGKLKGLVRSRGSVVIEGDAELKGDITAVSLRVEAGATLEGQLEVRPLPPAPVNGNGQNGNGH